MVGHAETFEKLSAAGGRAWSFWALASRSVWRTQRARVGESPDKSEVKSIPPTMEEAAKKCYRVGHRVADDQNFDQC